MKAVVYEGPHKVAVQDIENPRIQNPTDVLVRITTSGICGSDLHMYDGRTQVEPGLVFGHEPMGVVEEVGDAVYTIKKGDRVVMPFNVSCGFCFNCLRGFPNACLTVNPQSAGGAYGYVGMGPFEGAQAEYLRVPFADYNCVELPGEPNDEWEDDFLLLSDIFPTGFHATELANVQPGMSVAIFGNGPVGLLSAMCALLRGASEVYMVDKVQERLKIAKEMGCVAIDFSKGDPVEQILEYRQSNQLIQQSMRPGDEKMPGVMCGIDAVGYQAQDWEHDMQERSSRVMDDLVRLVNPTGHIGVIGVYLPQQPGSINEQESHGQFPIWFGKVWEKGISIRGGQTPVRQYAEQLRGIIINGRAKPSKIITKRIGFEQVQDAYERFDSREEGYTKVVLKPSM